jgi:tetratricopeptide (TPR) repeat protein
MTINGQESEAKALFQQANELYANDKFGEAAEKYEAIIDQGYLSTQVFFNLGNVYFKLNDLPKAIVNYERARLFDPNNEDIQYNLELTQTYLTDKIDALPDFKLKIWITQTSLWLSTNTWAILSLLCFAFALMFFLIYRKSNQFGLKKSSFILSVAMIVLTVATLYLGRRQKIYMLHNPYAIVEAPTVMVKSTPDAGSTDLFVIHEGLKVEIMDDYDDWYEIKLANGNKGWMPKDELLRISDFR